MSKNEASEKEAGKKHLPASSLHVTSEPQGFWVPPPQRPQSCSPERGTGGPLSL